MSNHRYDIKSQNFQKLNSKLMYISTSKYEGDWNSIPHIHHFTEIFYVIQGSGTFLLDDETFPIAAGDMIIVAPNVEHTEQSLNLAPLEYTVLGIDGITFLDSENPNSRILYNYSQRKDVRHILNLILQESQLEQPGYDLVCQYLLDVLLIQIMRRQKLVPAPISSAKMTKECGQVKRYLDANYSDNINLDMLASMTHMNKYYLVHAFTKYTGLSPINYLIDQRIKIGKNLLVTTNHSISQIASSIGFSSQSYFAQAFKKEVGMTPGEYRKSNVVKA